MGIADHQSEKMLTDEWLTPRYITDSLGPFDLDPCSPIDRPWDTAKNHFTVEDNGLLQTWEGFVWCNPPYGLEAARWLERMAMHNNGISLLFARAETRMFFDYIWNVATSVLFIKSRLHFHYVTGERADNNSGAPSILVGYGEKARLRLERSEITGKLIHLK
jgi:hypothetical protein